MKTKKYILHKYNHGDMITLRKMRAIIRILALSRQYPYKVLKHNKNGSITTEMEPNIICRVNIRRCYPYYTLKIDDNDHNVNSQPTNIKVV